MPSPVGHVLAGASIALIADHFARGAKGRKPQPDRLDDPTSVLTSGTRTERVEFSPVKATPRSGAAVKAGLAGRSLDGPRRSLAGTSDFSTLLVTCAVLAALPDIDLLYQPIHRAFTHSVGSTALVMIIAAAVTGWVTGRWSVGFAVLCGIAWGSHSVLDWFGADPSPPRGIKAFWPFSDRWFISDWDLFRGTERRHLFTLASMRYNARTIAQEVVMLAPIALALYWRRVTRSR
jgi:LexA-binding, inner membrane-associated putative hydrolase